jgi:hypothetical protein
VNSGPRKKNIVFDLDETLGSFTDLEILWSGLIKLKTSHNIPFNETQDDFNNLLDLYPEFARLGIYPIFNYLLSKKRTGECGNIYVYTNNQCKQCTWANYIVRYFETKTGPLIDRVIGTYKIGKNIVNTERTCQEKTYTDLVKCTMMSTDENICFIDNTYYEKMRNERVYYIQPLPYYHKLSPPEIVSRLVLSDLGQIWFRGADLPCLPVDFLLRHFSLRKGGRMNVEMFPVDDLAVSKKMMYYIRDFFYISRRRAKTRKHRIYLGKFTRKQRHNSYRDV